MVGVPFIVRSSGTSIGIRGERRAMARGSKWIEANGDDDVRVVACRALDWRLRRVWHFLELSVEEPPSEIENVHQLRVAARRAQAALDTFEPWLPRRRGRWIGKQAKRV